MNWDDLKYFLAVSRTGSVRAAAKVLDVNHATVSRRINSFEKNLGQRLFERSHKGYQRTAMGHQIFADACHLEETLYSVQRKVLGTHTSISGELRVTMPDAIAQELLMPWFAEFCRLHPNIEMEIIESTKKFNLSNREADIAFRFCNEPPEHLIGRKLAAKHKILNAALQASACRQGMGVAILPCFLGDTDVNLVRIPPYTAEPKYELWILRHPDLRDNLKIKSFVNFMVEKFQENKAMVEGKSTLNDMG